MYARKTRASAMREISKSDKSSTPSTRLTKSSCSVSSTTGTSKSTLSKPRSSLTLPRGSSGDTDSCGDTSDDKTTSVTRTSVPGTSLGRNASCSCDSDDGEIGKLTKQLGTMRTGGNRHAGYPSDYQTMRYKNGTRSSMTFSNDRVREIERTNAILLQKIMDKKKVAPIRPTVPTLVKPSAALARDRSKMQRKINLENALLDKRLRGAKSSTNTRHDEPR